MATCPAGFLIGPYTRIAQVLGFLPTENQALSAFAYQYFASQPNGLLCFVAEV